MLIALVATAFFLPTTPPTGRRTSLADPFRALRHKPLLLIALTAVFYNIGFFTILAAGPFALPTPGSSRSAGSTSAGALLLALVSVFVAPHRAAPDRHRAGDPRSRSLLFAARPGGDGGRSPTTRPW